MLRGVWGQGPCPAKGRKSLSGGKIVSLAQTFQITMSLKTPLMVLGVEWCLPLLGSPRTAGIGEREGATAPWWLSCPPPVLESVDSDAEGTRQEL